MADKHESHVTRFSFDASTWDEMCVNCGYTDHVPGGWGRLAEPCPVPADQRITLEEYHARRSAPPRAAERNGGDGRCS